MSQPADAALPRASRLTPKDWLGICAGMLLTLLITVVNSRGRVFWEDEMLGWTLLRDPSWRHMIHAWNLGADGGGFAFYLLGRGWFALVGASPLHFRLFSSVCFALALAVVWVALRSTYRTWMVAFAVLNTWFFSPPLAQHFIEGRFYGLLVLATALAVWLEILLETEAAVPLRPWRVGLCFVVHALLTTSHLLGVVFSAVLLAATVVLDALEGRRRWTVYVAMAASWLLLLPERQSIAAAAAVGKPHFWTKAPILREVIGAYTGFSPEIQVVFGVLCLVLLAGVVFEAKRTPAATEWRDAIRQRRAVYAAMIALFCVPLLFVLEGLRGTWLFNDRYLLPMVIAVCLATAELLQLVTERISWTVWLGARLNWVVVPGAMVYAAFLLFWEFHHVAQWTPSPHDYTAALTAKLPHGIPVVCEDAFTFTELMQHEHSSGVRYVFLLDWNNAVSAAAPRLEVTQFHLMQNWRKAGYFADSIQNADSFLAQNPVFLVLHAGPPGPETTPPEIGNPVAARLARDPRYEVKPLLVFDRNYKERVRDTVWLVCRGRCGTVAPMSQ